jgi:hypothetical protein
MASITQKSEKSTSKYNTEAAMTILLKKVDEAIDDMVQGDVFTIDEAWVEIDSI